MDSRFCENAKKTVVITGGNSGIGFHTAKKLAQKGFKLILAVRSEERGIDARRKILDETAGAKIDIIRLDVSDLESVRNFSGKLHETVSGLYALCNNAGIMWSPLKLSKQGYETHFATNHLGHFLLTGLLLDMLLKVRNSRIVTTTSIARFAHSLKNLCKLSDGTIFNRYTAYSNSKMMNFLFSYELSKRLKANSYDTLSISVHPGISRTRLFISGSRENSSILRKTVHAISGFSIGQPAVWGALPTVRAVTDPKIKNGDLLSPLLLGIWGIPVRRKICLSSGMSEFSSRLWDFSEACCGFTYDLPRC